MLVGTKRSSPVHQLTADWANVFANYLATLAVIAVGIWYCTRANAYNLTELDAHVALPLWNGRQIGTKDLLILIGCAYALALLPYYRMQPDHVSDARKALRYLWAHLSRKGHPPVFGREEQQAFLTILLKAFFVPYMVNALLSNSIEVFERSSALLSQGVMLPFLAIFNDHFYLIALHLLLTVDVVIFTVGYLIEIPALGNEIKSVDPTLGGWIACVICYPPFTQSASAIFTGQSEDFPSFDTPVLHITLNCVILAAMFVYAWSSVALGLRASNLTNRGIVARGPYGWVRHPAYASKNLAWWIGALPTLYAAFSDSLLNGAWALVCMIVWSLIYVARAVTEERHLSMIENGYAEYREQVRYRFVPHLW